LRKKISSRDVIRTRVSAFTPVSNQLPSCTSIHHYLAHKSVKSVNMFLSFNFFIVLAHVMLAVSRRPANGDQDLMANTTTIPRGQRHNETLATRTSLQKKKPHRSHKTGTKKVARLQRRSRSASSTPARLPRANAAPTPQPTGPSSVLTTVHITSVSDFAILLPSRDGGMALFSIFSARLTTLFSLRAYIRRRKRRDIVLYRWIWLPEHNSSRPNYWRYCLAGERWVLYTGQWCFIFI
jgi:hypothetical protein